MKALFIGLLVMVFSTLAFAQDVYVRGYTRRNGTYVAPHYRTAPDSTKLNNYSTQGNVNPYTGKSGTVNPYNTYQYRPSTSGSSYNNYRNKKSY